MMCKKNSGFTLVEMLVALGLASIISIAALKFYMAQNNNMITQQNVSDMQQNLRASMDAISHELRNAGANLPDGLPAFVASNANPDSVQVNYAPMNACLNVGDHVNKAKANPVHIAIGSDMSMFHVGDNVSLWHASTKTIENFTITKIATNSGVGWIEVHHQDADLKTDPVPGDLLINMRQVKFFLNTADSTHPKLMRQENNGNADVFADNVDGLNVRYIRSGHDTVDVLAASDTVHAVILALSAETNDKDYEGSRLGGQARRKRTLTSNVVVRNQRF